VREGRLRALAVTDFDRVRIASEVPTVMECGFPGAEMRGCAGVFAPARTPSAAIALLLAALRETLLDSTVQEFFRRDRDGALARYGPRVLPRVPGRGIAPHCLDHRPCQGMATLNH
jgi:hypothetical protein